MFIRNITDKPGTGTLFFFWINNDAHGKHFGVVDGFLIDSGVTN